MAPTRAAALPTRRADPPWLSGTAGVRGCPWRATRPRTPVWAKRGNTEMRNKKLLRGVGVFAIVASFGLMASWVAVTAVPPLTLRPAPASPRRTATKVTLSFSSWVPGMQKTVDLWNSQNPDIQVKYKQVVGGQNGTYQAYSNQLKAGNAGDLGMVEFDALPSFRVQDGLMNIGCLRAGQGRRGRLHPVDDQPGQLRRGRRGVRHPAGHRPARALLPQGPVRAGWYRRPHDVG